VKRHHRSILGINIQYTKDGKICLSTLAMIEIHEKHIAVNLKKDGNTLILINYYKV